MLANGPFQGPFALPLARFSLDGDKPSPGTSIFPSRTAA